MSIRGASSLRHPFLDLCRKLESIQKEVEPRESYPSRNEIWNLPSKNSELEGINSELDGEVL
ncbi:hypothetical protein EHQ64_11030 [Leptospira sarikeiensis]|uniref:Uncharacterized protein n=1 Tax=Leptospira sarikeiensis TaxID=2484943 RepID=A0A4R9K7Z8_9LEPT|nr:hypothetical protein EHQ64_11030 [Leptospira sarikeiensis]